MDYKQWTRADRLMFDEARNMAFQPTKEEIQQQKEAEEQKKKDTIIQKLQAIWVERPAKITKSRVKNLIWLDHKQQHRD